MIRYTMKCDCAHRFESWFQSGAAFDKLHSAGMIHCMVCGSRNVEKAVMAPSVASGRDTGDTEADPGTATAPARPLGRPAHPAQQALAALQRKITETSDDVGTAFVQEARDMHDGVTPQRPIHGQAYPEEARKLIEDGIPVLPLPLPPGRKAN